MTRKILTLFFAFCLMLPLSAQNWPEWRGIYNTGAVETGNPPIAFSETQNLKWKTEIPGKGHATPIVWNNQIIVLTAVATDLKGEKPESTEKEGTGVRAMAPNQTDLIHQFKVISVDQETGETLWETTVAEEMPLERTHDLGSWASNSPVTDGEYLFAYFGSRGLHCLDFKGNILWSRDFGQMEKVMSFGEGSTPALSADKVFVQWDHEGQSFVVAMDKKTGADIWKANREEGSSWATPLVVEVNGKTQVITAATARIVSYDAENGTEIWSGTGLTRNVIPNPMYANGMLYVMSGYRGTALKAIDLERARGNIDGTAAILWEYNQDTPYTPSGVVMNDLLFFLFGNKGIITCLDAKTGAVKYSKEKIEGISNIFSSPTGVDNRLYIAAEGTVSVLSAEPEFKVLSATTLDDTFHASPIFIGNKLILRGFKSLYCFEE